MQDGGPGVAVVQPGRVDGLGSVEGPAWNVRKGKGGMGKVVKEKGRKTEK